VKGDVNVDAVTILAAGNDARQQKNDVLILSEKDDNLLQQIRTGLSKNMCIIVEDWTFQGPQIQFDDKGLVTLRGSLNSVIQWQCKLLFKFHRVHLIIDI